VIESAFHCTAKLAGVLLVVSMAASGQEAEPTQTAAEVMRHVIAATGATPPANTVDTLKAGDPNTVITGS
jgi:hypothetical protein